MLELDPNYVRAYYSRGQALEKLGNKYEALAAYRHFLKTANPDADAICSRRPWNGLRFWRRVSRSCQLSVASAQFQQSSVTSLRLV